MIIKPIKRNWNQFIYANFIFLKKPNPILISSVDQRLTVFIDDLDWNQLWFRYHDIPKQLNLNLNRFEFWKCKIEIIISKIHSPFSIFKAHFILIDALETQI